MKMLPIFRTVRRACLLPVPAFKIEKLLKIPLYPPFIKGERRRRWGFCSGELPFNPMEGSLSLYFLFPIYLFPISALRAVCRSIWHG